MKLKHDVPTALKQFDLIAGAGSEDEKKACAMTLLAWCAGREWTDAPPCAHPLLRGEVIAVNDADGTTPEMRAEIVKAGKDGILDTWWVPARIVVWAFSYAEGEARSEDRFERLVRVLGRVAGWKARSDRGLPGDFDLTGANLARADLARADLTDANLARAYLADAYLARADLTGAYLARANLADAYLADANLADAYLARANLTGAYLADANLTRANLTGANLTGAYLARANLTGADLTGANLARAYLADAYLARANLTGADLARADLARANLAGAYLTDAYLAGAKGMPYGGMPDGWELDGLGLWVRSNA